MVAIFRQGDDSNDTESDQNDDGSPIYVDKLLGDIICINDIEVKVLIYIRINYFTHTQYWNSQKGKSIYIKLYFKDPSLSSSSYDFDILEVTVKKTVFVELSATNTIILSQNLKDSSPIPSQLT